MRIVPILMAVLVSALIYAFVFERARIAACCRITPEETGRNRITGRIGCRPKDGPMRVVVQRSSAREVDSAVTLRGRTEADRVVELRAETSGLVISEPAAQGGLRGAR